APGGGRGILALPPPVGLRPSIVTRKPVVPRGAPCPQSRPGAPRIPQRTPDQPGATAPAGGGPSSTIHGSLAPAVPRTVLPRSGRLRPSAASGSPRNGLSDVRTAARPVRGKCRPPQSV